MKDLHNTQNFTQFQSFELDHQALREIIGGKGPDKTIHQTIVGDEIFIKERINGEIVNYCIPIGSTQIF